MVEICQITKLSEVAGTWSAAKTLENKDFFICLKLSLYNSDFGDLKCYGFIFLSSSRLEQDISSVW